MIMEKSDNIVQLTCKTPGCGCGFRICVPSEAGTYEVICPNGHPNHIRVKRAEPVVDLKEIAAENRSGIPAIEGAEADKNEPATSTVSHTAMRVYGKLVVIPAGIFGRFKSKSYRLHPGPNTIGRHDKNCPSDVEIFDDCFVSRRSVVIDVAECDAGYKFKLTVMKAANPVLLNGRRLSSGEVIYLNYGDTIQLGNTRLNFIKI